MRRVLTTLLATLCSLLVLAQNVPALEQLKADVRAFYLNRIADADKD
jgi:hypothetical protein